MILVAAFRMGSKITGIGIRSKTSTVFNMCSYQGLDYSSGNIGSVGRLVLCSLVLERTVRLRHQRDQWVEKGEVRKGLGTKKGCSFGHSKFYLAAGHPQRWVHGQFQHNFSSFFNHVIITKASFLVLHHQI